MSDLMCPFSAPLVKKDFLCTQADEVIRRGGSEIACKNLESHTQCTKMHTQMKLAALAAMELEDDLLTVPHNTLVKIQYGGLLGLQAMMSPEKADSTMVENIENLVAQARSTYGELSNVQLEKINEAIANFKTQRRRKK
jgi:hypothetical protein